MTAAQNYSLPPAVLVGILHVEGGKVGQQVGPNRNGSYDLGPMQINTLWVPVLAKEWHVSYSTAKRWIRDDPCTNVNVAAWILRKNLDETKSLSRAISYYNSRTPHIGYRYKKKVLKVMMDKGLISTPSKTEDVQNYAFIDKK